MNRPRIATVLSARDWEPKLVDAARRDPAVRVVRRAYEPQDLDRAAPLDIVVVGAETSWITAARLRSIRKSGTRVVGIYPRGDGPGRDLLGEGGVDAALPDSTSPEELLSTVAMMAIQQSGGEPSGRLIAVTGPRGAPGRTEVAIAVARCIAVSRRSAILDLDTEAPSVAFRLGLEPGPDLQDAVDSMRSADRLISRKAGGTPELTVVAGATPLSTQPKTSIGICALVDALLAAFHFTTADIGPWRIDQSILATSDATILVCDAQPMSLIRAGHMVRDWEGPTPFLVINRVGPDQQRSTIRTARRALGLDPHTLVPDLRNSPDDVAHEITGQLMALATDLISATEQMATCPVPRRES